MTERPVASLRWPAEPPSWGQVRLRPFAERDVAMVMDLATDPYIPLIGSLPARATRGQALAYIGRQRGRLAEGAGFSFCVVRHDDDVAVGGVGLWLGELAAGRGSAGWAVAPRFRGHGFATQALRAMLTFAWTLPELQRVEARIEPWNLASTRVARQAGMAYEGTMTSYQPVGDRRADMQLYAVTRPADDPTTPRATP
jgi:RimJ/RimL family protein N-acetyltransferase